MPLGFFIAFIVLALLLLYLPYHRPWLGALTLIALSFGLPEDASVLQVFPIQVLNRTLHWSITAGAILILLAVTERGLLFQQRRPSAITGPILFVLYLVASVLFTSVPEPTNALDVLHLVGGFLLIAVLPVALFTNFKRST